MLVQEGEDPSIPFNEPKPQGRIWLADSAAAPSTNVGSSFALTPQSAFARLFSIPLLTCGDVTLRLGGWTSGFRTPDIRLPMRRTTR
ncbi:hypothetical protein GCM10011609_59320 [Lentzea pudingi]|uniref:Uncharacterized protein n=1 Tax=Lentzea pudingi TaxID=1789439 RepID=A0ABQ2IL15_9PSEU|nr:hypothetical protein GCM10011609_59320 [Lentzea pudingi]